MPGTRSRLRELPTTLLDGTVWVGDASGGVVAAEWSPLVAAPLVRRLDLRDRWWLWMRPTMRFHGECAGDTGGELVVVVDMTAKRGKKGVVGHVARRWGAWMTGALSGWGWRGDLWAAALESAGPVCTLLRQLGECRRRGVRCPSRRLRREPSPLSVATPS